MTKPKMKEFLKAMGRMQEEDYVTAEEFHKIFTAVMEAVKQAAINNQNQISELTSVADKKAAELETHFKTLLDAVDERMRAVKDGERGEDGSTPIAGVDYPDYQEIRDFITEAVADVPTLEDLEESVRGMLTIDEVKRGLESLEGNDRLSFEAINGIEDFIDESVRKMGAELRRGPMAITGGGTGSSSAGASVITDLTGTAYRVFYSDASGDVTELALGANGTYLKSNGASSVPTWATPAGSGDVSKVGTPVDGQIGVWTGDGTIEGDASLTFDTTDDTLVIAASGKLAFGAVDVLSDSAGTTTLSNIDALDATTEATIEAAIDTLANLTSATSLSITESQISDLGTYLTNITGENLEDLSNVTVTTLGADELLFTQDGINWINQTLAEAGIAPIASPTFTGTVTLPTGLTGVLRADSGVVSTDSDVTDLVTDAAADGATKGKATFTAADFSAASGVISLADTVIKNVDTDSGTAIPTSHVFNIVGGTGISTSGASASVTVAADVASTTAAGISELATSAEINTGTDTGRTITPDALAGSNFGIRYVSVVLNGTTALTTSDAAYYRIPAALNGMNLVSVAASVGTGAAGSSSSGTPTFTVKNVTDANQMLSTNLTVDANEYTSATAATAAVINTATDDVVTDDLIEVACTVAGTGVTYATITMGYQLP